MNLITFTEVDTTSPAEETVTVSVSSEDISIVTSSVGDTVSATAPAEESASVTFSPDATVAVDEPIVKETEGALDSSSSAPILTIGAIEGETVLLTAAPTTEASAAIGFEPMNFVTNLEYMGTGMLTIFIVIGAIILATTAINKIFSKKKD